MSRYLPPLLLFAVLAGVALRAAGRPARAETQERIRGLVEGAEDIPARDRLHDYLASFRETEDAWFGARMYLRLGLIGEAMDVVWGDPRIADGPRAGRRFAEMALETLGWEDSRRMRPGPDEPQVLLILAEGEDPWALARLEDYASRLELMLITRYYFLAYRRATPPPLRTLVRALRAREDEKYRTAAALGALGAEPYPERAADVAWLVDVIDREPWRLQLRSVWCVACLALGRSEDPAAVAALRKKEAQLAGSLRPEDQTDLLRLRNGLVAAGDWTVEAMHGPAVRDLKTDPMTVIWYLEALIYRYRRGDMRSELPLREMWEGPGAADRTLRHRAARAFLLQDTLVTEAARPWVDRMLRELEGPGAKFAGRVIAAAYRLRQGLPGARQALLALMRSAQGSDQAPDDAREGIIEALRALYLYD